jgi:hypothetical protein
MEAASFCPAKAKDKADSRNQLLKISRQDIKKGGTN